MPDGITPDGTPRYPNQGLGQHDMPDGVSPDGTPGWNQITQTQMRMNNHQTPQFDGQLHTTLLPNDDGAWHLERHF